MVTTILPADPHEPRVCSKGKKNMLIMHIKLNHKCSYMVPNVLPTKIVSEYDQEIPQSQAADNPVAPRGRGAQPSRDTRKTT